jgi:predicted O-methyltransferase YrrM
MTSRMAHIARTASLVGNTPHMTRTQAERMTEFIWENDISDILELGFRHGVSTTYMAAALAETGPGRIVTIDLASAQSNQPNVEELLKRIGERERVDVYYEPTSYTWRLMRFLQQTPVPQFDMCYVDGAHDWFVDGLAFFLVDRLLRPNGWIVFDDLDWTYDGSPALSGTDRVRLMPPDERCSPQVRLVFDLLVKQHPGYHNFREEGDWAFAQKMSDRSDQTPRQIVREVVVQERRVGLGGALIELARSMRRR